MRHGVLTLAAALVCAAMVSAAGFAIAQIAAGGQVTMMLTGGVERPLDRIQMPLVNGGNPAVKVALAQVRIADGAMQAKLTTRIGLLTFEADAPQGPGDKPAVRSAEFFDNAGATYRMGAGGAELIVDDYLPGQAVTFQFSSGMEGVDGAPPAGVSVQASTPILQ